MRWFWTAPLESTSSPPSGHDISTDSPLQQHDAESLHTHAGSTDEPFNKSFLTWHDFTQPATVIATLALTATLLLSAGIYASYLRRIPNISHIPAAYYRHRSLLGQVTSVGDADNFRLYHTPGGRFLGWSWPPQFSLRKIPTDRKALQEQTIHVRLAGIDAPELAHFGRPAQPYSTEALEWLRGAIEGKRVRIYPHKRDQYDRVVATVFTRPSFQIWRRAERAAGHLGSVPFLRKDVGLAMLQAGWATVYEAKQGAEFGGREARYRAQEQASQRAGRGMWGGRVEPTWFERWIARKKGKKNEGKFESPREYKTRMKALEEAEHATQHGCRTTASDKTW